MYNYKRAKIQDVFDLIQYYGKFKSKSCLEGLRIAADYRAAFTIGFTTDIFLLENLREFLKKEFKKRFLISF